MSSLSLNSAGSRLDAVGSSFAYDLTRRISAQGKGPYAAAIGADPAAASTDAASATDDEAAAALAEKQSQLSSLESALADTVSYMREKHGDKAASAMIGLVYKRLGEGEVNEETLGNAFLDVTRFIDRNFGIDAGDAFMDHLNGSLNEGINAFFDNGLNEKFMAVTSGPAGSGSIDASGLLRDMTQEYANAIKQMIEEARAKTEDTGLPGAYGNLSHNGAMVGVMTDVTV